MLLIITNRGDLACDYLVLRLQERGIPFERLNTEEYGRDSWSTIEVSQGYVNYQIQLESNRTIIGSELDGVYFRQPTPPRLTGSLPAHEREFAEEELLEALRSLWRVIPEKLWLNHPRNLWIASSKIDQLLAARACGLNIPDTLISNYKPHVIEFLSRPGHGFVAKAVKHSFIRRGGEVLLAGTQRLPKHYSEQLDDYAPLPMTYQREVLKDTDLRIIIVGQKVFATAIRIPESVPPTVDWRTAQLHGEELPHERIVLPQSIERKCGQLLAHFRLNFASMDMIKDESGHYIFLELNPNGQWAWIEQLTGYPIRDAIIDHLTSVRAS